jgi:NodT family efflux transporter outer membrane factor (OMF) lipoprotein
LIRVVRPGATRWRFVPPALLLAASGCTVGPDYRAPEPQAPAAFAGPQAIQPADVDLAHWWTAFRDPELERLIAIGLRQAPDLQTAASRVRQARLGLIQARAAGLPQVNAAGNGQYLSADRIGDNSDIPELVEEVGRTLGVQNGGAGTGTGSQVSGLGVPFNDVKLFSAGFDASWEIDLFGRVRRQVESARAREDAAVWDARDARVQLAAEIARLYLQMRGYQQQGLIARSEADRQARSLQLLQHTAQAGLVPEGNATRQRTQLANARARIAPLEAGALTQMHALAALVGETPEALIDELKIERPFQAAPPAVPPGLPIDLIRRRPDVRAAERQLAAATAQIGVSVADLYPRITLTAMPQLAAAWLGGFFVGNTLQLTASGAVSFPILDWGRRRAQVEIAREQREQAYIQWRQAVLGALRDVEDALVRYEGERRSNLELQQGVKGAERSLASVTAQYRVGLQNLQPVLDTQQTLLTTRDSLAQSDVRLRQDLASLYKALGGGWRADDPDPARPVIVDAAKERR